MPYSPLNPNPTFGTSAYPQVYPGTSQSVTHSFSDRLMEAEFDDALVDQAFWKRSRYEGSKATALNINQYAPPNIVGIGSASIGSSFTIENYIDWPGDVTYQNLPTIRNVSTALYIANTVIGGTEDPQFATLKNHSYVSVNKILFINLTDNSVTVINKTTEPYEEFHRFLTNDFPTGNRVTAKLIDENISNNMTENYRVKMNKGFLLKSFKFNHAGEFSGSTAEIEAAGFGVNGNSVLTENNSMYVYRTGSISDDFVLSGSSQSPEVYKRLGNKLRFRYGVVEMNTDPRGYSGDNGFGSKFNAKFIGPHFNSSSIFENKYTQQYYSGSFGLISGSNIGDTPAKILSNLGLGSASRFLGKDTLSFLASNNADASLTEQEKTEVHITFFEGTKDFAPGKHDERSISTFEVDQQRPLSDIGDKCNDFLPRNHELTFKGNDDSRFLPTLPTYGDSILSAHPVSVSGSEGCTALDAPIKAANTIQEGHSIDLIKDAEIIVQGGALGAIGFSGVHTASSTDYGESTQDDMTSDNFYSGSFSYEMSFLDKNHTLILNIDKETELFDGIGEKGLVLIPENSHPQITNNIEYYLSQAGIIDETNSNLQNFNLS